MAWTDAEIKKMQAAIIFAQNNKNRARAMSRDTHDLFLPANPGLKKYGIISNSPYRVDYVLSAPGPIEALEMNCILRGYEPDKYKEVDYLYPNEIGYFVYEISEPLKLSQGAAPDDKNYIEEIESHRPVGIFQPISLMRRKLIQR